MADMTEQEALDALKAAAVEARDASLALNDWKGEGRIPIELFVADFEAGDKLRATAFDYARTLKEPHV